MPIEATRAGYVLDPAADPVIPAAVMPRLTSPLAGPVTWTPEIGSTNDDAAQLARDGAPEGTVIGSDHQTAGRGRRGRAWVDAPGEALMYTVILRPRVSPIDAGMLPLVIAVGLADALDEPDVEADDGDVGAALVAGVGVSLSSATLAPRPHCTTVASTATPPLTYETATRSSLRPAARVIDRWPTPSLPQCGSAPRWRRCSRGLDLHARGSAWRAGAACAGGAVAARRLRVGSSARALHPAALTGRRFVALRR
jgi:hypothetical protein